MAKQQAEDKTKRKGGQIHQLFGPTPQEAFYKESRDEWVPPGAVGPLVPLGQRSHTDHRRDSFGGDGPGPSTSASRDRSRNTTKNNLFEHTPYVDTKSGSKSRPGSKSTGGGFGAHAGKKTSPGPRCSDEDDDPVMIDKTETKAPRRSQVRTQQAKNLGNNPGAKPMGKTNGEKPKPEDPHQGSSGHTAKAPAVR